MSKKQKTNKEKLKDMPVLWLFVHPGNPSKNGRDKEDKNDRPKDTEQS